MKTEMDITCFGPRHQAKSSPYSGGDRWENDSIPINSEFWTKNKSKLEK